MNNYTPNEVKDLTDSKQRVMRNVMNRIENNSRSPKHKLRYVVITAVLIMSAMLFVINELFIENEQQSATELHLDLTKPTFSEEQGLFYLHGVTLGDSQSKVIERFGENYTIDQEDGSGADFFLEYDDNARFYFKNDKLDSIVFYKVDENYFDKLFNDYNGFKFISSVYVDEVRFFYSKETSHIIKASTEAPEGSLSLSLYYPGPDLWENAEYLKTMEENIKKEQPSSTELHLDLTQPTFSEEQGLLYLHGVTLGDTQSKVIKRFGENYIIGNADGSGADFFLEYDGNVRLYFINDKLDLILFTKVDKNYFDILFNEYDGFKFISPTGTDVDDHYIYSKETSHILKATIIPEGNLYFYLSYAGPELWENTEFLKMMEQNSD